MRPLLKKLKDRRGASMLFALLLFLLCLFAGMAALTAAAANAGRYAHLEDEQQQYFSAASALALLQAELDSDDSKDLRTVTLIYTETEDWWYEPDGAGGYTLQTGRNPTYKLEWTPAAPDLNYAQALLFNACVPQEWQSNSNIQPPVANWPAASAPSYPYQYTIKPADTMTADWAETIRPVSAEVTLNDDGHYTLEMDLTTGDGSAYPLHVVWTGEADVDTQTETSTAMHSGSPPVTPPGTTGVTSYGTRTTVTTLICTLRWSADNRTVTFAG